MQVGYLENLYCVRVRARLPRGRTIPLLGLGLGLALALGLGLGLWLWLGLGLGLQSEPSSNLNLKPVLKLERHSAMRPVGPPRQPKECAAGTTRWA